MTENKKTWRTSGALIAAATAGAFGVGLFAAPAQAHTPVWEVTCSQVTLDLTRYGTKADNTVNVTVDGKDLLPTESFKGEFHKKLELPEHSKELTVRLVVKASDGDQYSRDETKTAPVCADTPKPSDTPKPTPTESSPAESSPAPSASAPSTEPSTATSSAAAVPSAKPSTGSGDLAETGSSSATPIIAGAAAVVIVAGGGLVWATRKRRGSARG
ncbi:LAETG motif-containing sortase-dependent surface protein [Streptomyces sp. NPDC046821]|uniref:LAETG motif-containing sortase-dependent surface protein n=1 Tax=Streptomyces sp. NPDC046821 TaxID=3154702 RepID=UPI0033CA29C4